MVDYNLKAPCQLTPYITPFDASVHIQCPLLNLNIAFKAKRVVDYQFYSGFRDEIFKVSKNFLPDTFLTRISLIVPLAHAYTTLATKGTLVLSKLAQAFFSPLRRYDRDSLSKSMLICTALAMTMQSQGAGHKRVIVSSDDEKYCNHNQNSCLTKTFDMTPHHVSKVFSYLPQENILDPHLIHEKKRIEKLYPQKDSPKKAVQFKKGQDLDLIFEILSSLGFDQKETKLEFNHPLSTFENTLGWLFQWGTWKRLYT